MAKNKTPQVEGIVLNKKKKKFKVFPLVNGLLFIIFSLFILLPIWKVIVDSIDLSSAGGLNFWPHDPSIGAYRLIVTRSAL